MEILAASYQDFPPRKPNTYHALTAQSHVFLVVQCFARSYSSIPFMEDWFEDYTQLSHIDKPAQLDYIYRLSMH